MQDPTATPIESIEKRINEIEASKDIDFRGNKHLDDGSTERNYWHKGYASALRDVMELFSKSTRTSN